VTQSIKSEDENDAEKESKHAPLSSRLQANMRIRQQITIGHGGVACKLIICKMYLRI